MIVYPLESSVSEPCVPGMLNGALRAVKCIKRALPLLHASQGCQESLYFDGCFSPVKPLFCLQEMVDAGDDHVAGLGGPDSISGEQHILVLFQKIQRLLLRDAAQQAFLDEQAG